MLLKIKNKQKKEAYSIYSEYKKRFNEEPNINIFHEYFYLFENKYDNLTDTFRKKLNEEHISKDEFEKNDCEFNSYNEFLNYCKNEYEKKIDKVTK